MVNQPPDILIQEISDTKIPYLHYPAQGPPLIFLHATGFFPWLWHPIARRLSERFSIFAPYFCDHRESDPHNGGLGWRQLADDLVHFCDALNIEHPYFVGHSMGATVITLANAIQNTFARKIILIEPIFLPQEVYRIRIPVTQHPLAAKAIKRRNLWQNTEAVYEDFTAKPFFQAWDREMLDLYIRFGTTPAASGGLQLTCAPEKEAALFMGSMQCNPWPLLPKVDCPVLVLEGGLSENKHFLDLPKTASLFPKGAYRMVQDAGHLIPMEKPVEIVEIIDHFFQEPTL